MSAQVTPDVVLDATGQLCPMPVIRAKQAMDKLAPGQVMKLVASDPGSKADIPGWARTSGHTLLEASTEGKTFVFLVKKG